ncbi:MAG: twitching motility protein PilT [Betaproteobacteria bacterium RIFCSPLOWO2_12_FULL_65_14]|nr:MAG: twitching motility protein PilT [Betaproteobacteria bacterium RIFCSPLOWO2_12_FULL_65_14]
MIVLDASAALELLLNTPAAPRVAKRILSPRESLHAPHLIDLEVTQVLRRWERGGALPPARAEEALEDLGDLPLVRYPHQLLLPRIWSLRANATAYDAAYLVLAEVLGATLVTTDAALASVPGHAAQVEVIR